VIIHLTPALFVGAAALILAVILWIFRRRIARGRRGLEQFMPIAAWLTGVLGAWLLLSGLSPDQTPWSDRTNPLPQTVTTAAAGEQLYQANCAACHGVDARGGGPQSGTTAVRPPSLVGGHTATHTDGDLLYWITNGLPGGMPAWGPRLSETERWEVITYVRSLKHPPGSPGPTAAASVGSGSLLVVLPLGLAGGLVSVLVAALAGGVRARSRRRSRPERAPAQDRVDEGHRPPGHAPSD
jgi:mono/diheme cytochrome c family protein